VKNLSDSEKEQIKQTKQKIASFFEEIKESEVTICLKK